MHADKEIARRNNVNTNNNNNLNDVVNIAMSMKFWKVGADCALMAYRALWSDMDVDPLGLTIQLHFASPRTASQLWPL